MSSQNTPAEAVKSVEPDAVEPDAVEPDAVEPDAVELGLGRGVGTTRPWSGRTRIVSVALAVSSLTMAVLLVWRPGAARNDFSYEAVTAVRDATWATSVVDGIAMAVAAVMFGLATCILVTARGARWATIGAVLTGLGGIMFCGGGVAFGTVAWYVTDQAALPAEPGARLLSHIEENFDRIGALLIPGFLMFTVGSLVLAVALWRSRAIPRWWPSTFAALTVVLFVGLSGWAMDLVQAVQLALLVVVAAYAWRATVTR